MRRWLVAIAVVVVACAPSGQGTDAGTSSAVAAGDSEESAIPAALNFRADLVAGGQIEGGDLAGRDVVLWFWAPW